MIRWERTDRGLRVSNGERRRLAVDAPDWSPDPDASGERVAVGAASELGFPRVPASVRSEDATAGSNAPVEVGDGPHVLTVEAALHCTVRFRGPAAVTVDDRVRLSLPERRRVRVTFGREAPDSSDALSVPPTAAGVAAAVTAAGATPRTTTPARSDPAERPHPPLFDTDPDAPPPDAEPATGVRIAVPDVRALFAATPLAYYAGAELRVESEADSRLSVPDAGVEAPLGTGAERAPALLRRVFLLDCLVREGDPRVEAAGLDAGVGDLTLSERIPRYLDADPTALSLPSWPLASYVEASVERALLLPSLLARMATIHPPETKPLSGKALMERSLDAFYRGDAPAPNAVELCEPTLAPGDLHCWHAPETPIDVYQGRQSAYRNRLDRAESDARGPLSVAVVCNEDRMRAEGRDALAAYRGREELDVRRHRNLGTEELAAVFRADHDLVHFVGHCEPAGLRCADGALAAADVGPVGARTFLLNACGSHREGLALVDAGAVAGAVTYRQVLDEQAARVGTAFARLLASGFAVERALRLSRRRVMMGKDYGVVGDGTHAVVSPAETPMFVRVTPAGAEYEVRVEAAPEGGVGGRYLPPFADAEPRLRGDAAGRTLNGGALRELFARRSMPVLFDGEFRWSDALVGSVERE